MEDRPAQIEDHRLARSFGTVQLMDALQMQAIAWYLCKLLRTHRGLKNQSGGRTADRENLPE